jgi:hypothetical protein
MNHKIFNAVAIFLYDISRRTGLTYKEINILVYFFVIPFSWALLLDMALSFHYLTIAVGVFYLGFAVNCKNFKVYVHWLFEKSVSFLNYFNRYGSTYVLSSVIFCVLFPALIYAVLIAIVLLR